MNYQKQYASLMARQKLRTARVGYMESHHILPECKGGPSTPENLVWLTAREHYVAHQLLAKIYPKDFGLLKAARMMTVTSINHDENRSNNRMYGWLRERFAEMQSEAMRGSGNPQYGQRWVYLNNTQIRVPVEEAQNYLDDGWRLGRKPYIPTPRKRTPNEKRVRETTGVWSKQSSKRQEQKTANVQKKLELVELYNKLYVIYDEFGFDVMVQKTGYKYSKPNFVNMCSRYASNFSSQNGKKRGK